jgi:hypothetical protein
MTWEEFTKQAEASPFTWEIFGEYNDLIFEGYSEQQAYSAALQLGYDLEQEALAYERKLSNEKIT